MNHRIRRINFDDTEIILLGTAHVSKESVAEVNTLIQSEQPDCICVELDEARLAHIKQEKQWQEVNISKVIREKKGFLLIANLLLASFQKKIGEDVGVKPGDEMREAVHLAETQSIQLSLVDRPIQITLKRAWAKNNFIGKSKLFGILLASIFSDEKLSAEEIELLKQKSAMDTMMQEIANYSPTVKEVLIDERDLYIASKIWESTGKKRLAVLGAGHLAGTEKHIRAFLEKKASSNVAHLTIIPPPTKLSKLAGWLFPALIIGLIGAGFFIRGSHASFNMLLRWLFWNGSLAALGTLLAGGHIPSILASFFGAPIATLNPFIGFGLVTGLTQAWIKKPQVKDMETLHDDIGSFKGWYKNKIAHALLVFMFSSFGGAIGNFIAVPALFQSLF